MAACRVRWTPRRDPTKPPPAAPAALPWPTPARDARAADPRPLPQRPVPPTPAGSAQSTGRAALRCYERSPNLHPSPRSRCACSACAPFAAAAPVSRRPLPCKDGDRAQKAELAAPRKLAPQSPHECLQLPHPVPLLHLFRFRKHQGMAVRIVGEREIQYVARHGLLRRRRALPDDAASPCTCCTTARPIASALRNLRRDPSSSSARGPPACPRPVFDVGSASEQPAGKKHNRDAGAHAIPLVPITRSVGAVPTATQEEIRANGRADHVGAGKGEIARRAVTDSLDARLTSRKRRAWGQGIFNTLEFLNQYSSLSL